jgi:RNA polymerase sigma-70 factor (ECF subfamily)
MDAAVQRAEGEPDELADTALIARVLAGETALFERLMRRYNRRLYRVARAVLRDDGAAEDALQEAYVQAYTHLHQFAGRARLSSWLTRIVVNEALRQRRKRGGAEEVQPDMPATAATTRGPEDEASRGELRAALERAVDALPDAFRSTFVLRSVEELSIAETAECLGIAQETVKTRLHRARALLRRSLQAQLGAAVSEIFPFGFARCDRIVAAVMARLPRGAPPARAPSD